MEESSTGVPPITAPWPAKDVSRGKCRSGQSSDFSNSLDCIHCRNRPSDAGRVSRVVSLAFRIPVLLGEGISEGRSLEHQSPCCDNDGSLHGLSV
jgi:hypothetical protein